MKLTALEIQVFNHMIDECYLEAYDTVNDISAATKLSVNVVKGVIGSLCKKGLVLADGSELNPVVNGEVFSFGCDDYSEDETEEFKLK